MRNNSSRFTKKGVIAAVLLLLLLAGAVWLNIRLKEDGGETDAMAGRPADAQNTDQNSDAVDGREGTEDAAIVGAGVYEGYFAGFREERSSIRAQEIDFLRMIVEDESTDAETRRSAQERLMQLVSNMEQEFSIESKLRSKGFRDAAVTFRNDSVTVVIDGETLSDEEVARILDIIRSETGVSAQAVRISLSRGAA
ncbi:MAG: SpoIIIAH-like family protein [Clostridia bacterium]|nr:SpoIIIAH-like family protein [Clostridia bacterium]